MDDFPDAPEDKGRFEKEDEAERFGVVCFEGRDEEFDELCASRSELKISAGVESRTLPNDELPTTGNREMDLSTFIRILARVADSHRNPCSSTRTP